MRMMRSLMYRLVLQVWWMGWRLRLISLLMNRNVRVYVLLVRVRRMSKVRRRNGVMVVLCLRLFICRL